MKRQNWLLILAVVLLTALPLWLVPQQGIGAPTGPDAQPREAFGGADEQAQQLIGQIAPNYQPWFAPLLEPASGEIAALLFALQAAIGAGFIGYWLGSVVTRERLRQAAEANKDQRAD